MNQPWITLLSREVILDLDFAGGSAVKNLPANAGNAGDAGSISVLGRSFEEGNGNPLQYSYLGNPMDREACQDTVHRFCKELDMT